MVSSCQSHEVSGCRICWTDPGSVTLVHNLTQPVSKKSSFKHEHLQKILFQGLLTDSEVDVQ